ncbi:hypothetical protein ACFL02_07710, partial [Planctomycetota bacterium]
KIQDNKEIDKTELYVEIAGDYELDIGRILPFKVLFKGEKLYFDALVEGLEPEEMRLAAGKEMVFESIDPNGDEVTFSFYRDSLGRISGCTVVIPVRGTQAEAAKIIKAGTQVETAKLYAELAGSYEFDVGERIVPFWLIAKNGKLFLDINVEGVDLEEVVLVDVEKLKFETIANGYQVIGTFKRNDQGKIIGCTLYYPEMGTKYEAVKKDKSR